METTVNGTANGTGKKGNKVNVTTNPTNPAVEQEVNGTAQTEETNEEAAEVMETVGTLKWFNDITKDVKPSAGCFVGVVKECRRVEGNGYSADSYRVSVSFMIKQPDPFGGTRRSLRSAWHTTSDFYTVGDVVQINMNHFALVSNSYLTDTKTNVEVCNEEFGDVKYVASSLNLVPIESARESYKLGNLERTAIGFRYRFTLPEGYEYVTR